MTAAPTVTALWADGTGVPVAVREAWALAPSEIDALLSAARAEGLGACVVSTCFRLEVLLAGPASRADLEHWGRRHLAGLRPALDPSVFRAAEGEDAARHLFRVAAGLESAVLGEPQILGQVRRARATAEAARTLAPALRAILDAAVRAGQRVRHETGLSRGSASTASAAVQWAHDTLGGLAARRVAVVGGGQMGRLLVEQLTDYRPASLTLVSGHAPAHAGFEVVRPDGLPGLLPRTDVLFAATDRGVLDLDTARHGWADGARRAVADLGVPRNVAPEVGTLPGVALADIDALGAVVDAGLGARRAAVPEAEALLDAELAALRDALDALGRERLVGDFRRRAEAIRRDTLAYVCDLCDERTCAPDGADGPLPGPGPCSDPDGLTRTLTTRLLHDVTAALREARDLDDAALRRLLALPGPSPDA